MNLIIKKGKHNLEIKEDDISPNLLLNFIMKRSDKEQQRSITLNRADTKILIDKLYEWLQ